MDTRKDEGGFTLMEIVVSLAILTIVIGVAFMLLNRFQQSYRYEDAYADAQRNGRFAIARLNEIIRTAGTNPTGDMIVNGWRFVEFGSAGNFPTGSTAGSGDSLRLKSDLNGDRQAVSTITSESDVIVTSENVVIRFEAATRRIIMTDLNLTGSNSVTPLADNISSLSFSDPDGSRREVLVELVATPSGIAVSDPMYREVRYRSTIRLRNRK
jgi:prepilin-type N-terminal cleavage/methylation domain-containing protein